MHQLKHVGQTRRTSLRATLTSLETGKCADKCCIISHICLTQQLFCQLVHLMNIFKHTRPMAFEKRVRSAKTRARMHATCMDCRRPRSASWRRILCLFTSDNDWSCWDIHGQKGRNSAWCSHIGLRWNDVFRILVQPFDSLRTFFLGVLPRYPNCTIKRLRILM
jgi:hypothetical protein